MTPEEFELCEQLEGLATHKHSDLSIALDAINVITKFTGERKLIAERVRLLKKDHYHCDDSWYSCPLAVDGTLNPESGTECNCKALMFNKELEEFASSIERGLE